MDLSHWIHRVNITWSIFKGKYNIGVRISPGFLFIWLHGSMTGDLKIFRPSGELKAPELPATSDPSCCRVERAMPVWKCPVGCITHTHTDMKEHRDV